MPTRSISAVTITIGWLFIPTSCWGTVPGAGDTAENKIKIPALMALIFQKGRE